MAGIQKPNPKYALHIIAPPITLHRSPIPESHKIALTDPNWNAAIHDEYSAFINTGT